MKPIFVKNSLIHIVILISISILCANLLSMCHDIIYLICVSVIGGREGREGKKKKSLREAVCQFTMPQNRYAVVITKV